ncbi:hypothetical protein ACF1CY_000764 [Providencia rettgeri]
MRNQYWCPTCDKPFPPENFPIHVGDTVDYMTQQVCKDENGRRFLRYQAEEGEVLKIEGENAFIACEGGDKDWFPLGSLTLSAAPNALTMALSGVCECKREGASND